MQVARGQRWRQPVALRALVLVASLATSLVLSTGALAQDLGHKIPGGVGVDAGVQGPAGLYVADRLFYYAAERLVDRTGAPLPVEGFELDAVGNGLGVLGTLKLSNGTHLSATVALPIARIAASSDEPRSSIDRFGLGDLYVMPLKLGWRLAQLRPRHVVWALRPHRGVRGTSEPPGSAAASGPTSSLRAERCSSTTSGALASRSSPATIST